MLEVRELGVSYGPVVALKSVSLDVASGAVTTIIGANGAGKSSCLAAISGLVKPQHGRVLLDGQPIEQLSADARLRRGIAHVLEGRRLFGDQTVEDNLTLGAYVHRRTSNWSADTKVLRETMYRRFPILGTRHRQLAQTLSGGEQMMLAIAVALMSRPRVLLLDEPSLGLAPKMVRAVTDLIGELRRDGMTILLVEQMASMALRLADYAYAFQRGSIVLQGSGKELLDDSRFHSAYFGADQRGAAAR
ncbi:MAG: ABC transporter ATP-binding protein [Lautropia sp.]